MNLFGQEFINHFLGFIHCQLTWCKHLIRTFIQRTYCHT